MQGQRSAIGSLPETLGFNHGSTPTDGGGIDPQICWNNLLNPAQSRLPDYVALSNETNTPFLNPANQERQNIIGWNLGESSSSGAQNNVNLGNSTYFSQGSTSGTVPHDLNKSSGHDDDEDDDDCQIMECIPAFKSDGPGKELAGPSGTDGFLMEESDDRPDCSLDGRRTACKRKALEGQSSGSGSSSYLENSLWHSLPAPNNMATTGANISRPTVESSRSINLSEQVNPRLGLTMGGGASMESPVGLTASSRSTESFRRNFRLRINGSHQQASIPSNLLPTVDSSRLLDLRSVSAADNGNPRGQPTGVQVPPLRRSGHRWDLSSSARAGSSSSFSIFGERDPTAAYEEPSSRTVPRNISQHPMFIPATTDLRTLIPNPATTDLRTLNPSPSANWSFTGGNTSVAGGSVASTSRSGPSSGVAPSSSPSWGQPRNPQQSRRLTEFVRRSLISSAGGEPGSHSANAPQPRVGPTASSEMVFPVHHHASSSRMAMLERQLDGAVPYSWRSLAAATEGRSRLVSEIRNVLDLMRRGEGLRIEDVMILDQSVLFGMADIHDRHRDMRLDVDNMSYEELLALEERIGNVCTGLSEETILNRLSQHKYVCITTEETADAEPCCVCQEEYKDGEDLGKLECGHDFHKDCIKEWLMQKNICPICKTTGLNN